MSNDRSGSAGQHWVLVVNGELPVGNETELRQLIATADRVVAVDGGLKHCATLAISPDVLIGDLDSATPELVELARSQHTIVHEFAADKDATDLELALELAVEAGACDITVLAAFGGRLDHELATLSLVASDRWNTSSLTVTDGSRHAYVVRDHCTLRMPPGTTLSLLPWHGRVDGVTTHGLQWPLADATLAPGTTHGISNVATEPVQRVAVSSGVLLVVIDTR